MLFASGLNVNNSEVIPPLFSNCAINPRVESVVSLVPFSESVSSGSIVNDLQTISSPIVPPPPPNFSSHSTLV